MKFSTRNLLTKKNLSSAFNLPAVAPALLIVDDPEASIVSDTRKELAQENPRISTHISTRASVEMAGLLYDGFNILECAEVTVYPQYDDAGGLDSERTFIKQVVQKYADDGSSEDLFNVEDENEYAEVQ